jgi:hypothetical protein
VKHWRIWALGVLLVWFVAVTWWVVRPVSDTVPTGIVNNVQTAQTVQCDSPLSGNQSATGPLLQLQSGRAYERTPCEQTIKGDRVMFAVDIAVALAILIVLAATWKRTRASRTLEVASAA